jgi:hypothetical protein
MKSQSRIALFVALISLPAVAAPQLKPEKNKFPSLAGSTWSGNTFEKQTMVLAFGKEGQVTITYNGGPVQNTNWKQDGEKVCFSMNDKYCEFDGKIVGDRIEGECYNVAKTRWNVTLTRTTQDR